MLIATILASEVSCALAITEIGRTAKGIITLIAEPFDVHCPHTIAMSLLFKYNKTGGFYENNTSTE